MLLQTSTVTTTASIAGIQIGLYFLIEGHASLLTCVIVSKNKKLKSHSTIRSKMKQTKRHMKCDTSADFSSVVLPEEQFLFKNVFEYDLQVIPRNRPLMRLTISDKMDSAEVTSSRQMWMFHWESTAHESRERGEKLFQVVVHRIKIWNV